MKKGIFLLATLLSFTGLVANNTNTTNNNIGVNYRFDDAVTFIERGIEFHVFLDGGFDFNANSISDVYYDYNGNRVRRNLQIQRDRYGAIRRIGNTVINYNFNGNVASIGNVAVRYRFGQLSSVGNLNVDYDRWGYPHFRGFVQSNRFFNDGFNININLGTICNYDDVYFYNRNFRNNYRQFREDNNFFYYRAIPNARIGNRNKIIKRRKPNRSVVKSNNRYLKNNRTVKSNNRNIRNNNRTVNKTRNTVKSNNRNIRNNNRTVNTTRNTVKSNNRNIKNNNRTVKTTRTTVKPNNRNNNRTVKTTRTVVKNNKRSTTATSDKKKNTNTRTSSKRRTR